MIPHPPELHFERPAECQATLPPELRGVGRDDVRLLVTRGDAVEHHRFADLPSLLRPGDLLVANDSATVPASLQGYLPARLGASPFVLNLSTRYGARFWLAEPRSGVGEPGPLALLPGDEVRLGATGGLRARMVAPHPGLERLWFVTFETAVEPRLAQLGRPIRYAHVAQDLPLASYQTVFARVPGSAEMPSAGRPFTRRVLRALAERGVEIATVTLHTGVSSLELDGPIERATLFAEPFVVPALSAEAVNRCRAHGGRVVAVGTTVVRALESAVRGGHLRPMRGFTRRFVRPGQFRGSVDGIVTGLHDPGASHLALLHAVAGGPAVRASYAEAVANGYLWHEFGDVHLALPAA